MLPPDIDLQFGFAFRLLQAHQWSLWIQKHILASYFSCWSRVNYSICLLLFVQYLVGLFSGCKCFHSSGCMLAAPLRFHCGCIAIILLFVCIHTAILNHTYWCIRAVPRVAWLGVHCRWHSYCGRGFWPGSYSIVANIIAIPGVGGVLSQLNQN